MTDLAEPPAPPSVADAPAPPAAPGAADLAEAPLSPSQKAAIILGILGAETAGPLLEQMGEAAHRSFAAAMSKLHRVQPHTVAATIQEFLQEVARLDMTVSGGLDHARALLSECVNDETLTRIMDEVDSPSTRNVWLKLAQVDDTALGEFLANEHPQTVAVVLSKLSAEHAARLIGRLDAGRAREIVVGLTKTAALDPAVVEAIGASVSRDFLANQRGDATRAKPAERVGAIMNYTTGTIRNAVLNHLDTALPDFAEEVKRKMFTFQDIPTRVEKRDVAQIVRAVENEVLLSALAGAAENAPTAREFILSSISSRVAEQIRADLAELGEVKVRDAEDAQTEVMMAIRALEGSGELKLISLEE